MDQKCIFCAIVEKKIPHFQIYDDKDFVAFLDINPINKGHTLIVPKKHYRWTYDVSNFGFYWEIAKKIAIAQVNGLGAKFVQFLTAGLAVQHAHIHVIPRYENDGHGEMVDTSRTIKLSEQEFKQIAEKIKSSIPVDQPKVPKPIVAKVKPKKYSDDKLDLFKRDIEQT